MSEDQERTGLKKDILGFIPVITSPIGLTNLPEPLLRDLHRVMRQAVIWIKAWNADELED